MTTGSKTQKVLAGMSVIVVLVMMAFACGYSRLPDHSTPSGDAQIYPDYTAITLPVNIAPLNFNITVKAEKYLVRFTSGSGNSFSVKSRNGTIATPSKKWKWLLKQSKDSLYTVQIHYRLKGQWYYFDSIVNHVSSDVIDPYVAYRKIEPGYETWNKMGIYQRNIENFNEDAVIVNDLTGGNCMNCHSFAAHNPSNMLFHVRAAHSGTIICRNGSITKVNTQTDSTISAGVYPAWHPGGKYIAFSVNHIVQSFHALPDRKVEVIDTLSDLILYDAEQNRVMKEARLTLPDRYETFPAWSPDGHFLYYCCTENQNYRQFEETQYNILRISFDATSGKFGQTDTVVAARKNGYSASFPRISPDGRYLLFARSRYGNFTIWHGDSDLALLNLENGEITDPQIINSRQAESYHTWSSTGRWVVFSSRRDDGLYTRLYFSYFDRDGNMHKPFMLPQRDPSQNTGLLKSYNVPEFIKGRISVDPRELSRIIKTEAQQASYTQIR
ncbi:MAG: PD40 domain-containing protein [Bacteroidales bacterium]|nr:PD40 domain-containing protein [Bacteroidales bacterium]